MNRKTNLLAIVAIGFLWAAWPESFGSGQSIVLEDGSLSMGDQIQWGRLSDGMSDPYWVSGPGNDPDEDCPPEIFSGRAAYFEVFTIGSSALPGQEGNPISGNGGNGGSIEIHAGVDTDAGDGSDGVLNSWVVLGPDETRYYKYVGFGDGSLTSQDRFVTITVRGKVTIYCQHNFMANIQADYSHGVPEVTIHAGRPTPIRCFADGRFAGTSQSLPHAVGCYFVAPSGKQSLAGGTFRFYTEYAGDLNVFLCADGGTAFHGGDGGSITVVNDGGDIRGEASAVEGNAYVPLGGHGAEGSIHLDALARSGNSSITGRFWTASQYTIGADPGWGGQNVELQADNVRQLPLGTAIEYDYPAAHDVVPELLLSLIPPKPLTDGVYIGQVEVAGSDSNVEIKTGVTVDVGDGSDGPLVASMAILEPGTYNLAYACGDPDMDSGLLIYVKGDTVIRCRYLFNATIRAHPSCQDSPKVTVCAGTPMLPIGDATDPAWLLWSLAHCNSHCLNADMSIIEQTFMAMHLGNIDIVVGSPGSLRKVAQREVDRVIQEIGGAPSSGLVWPRALVFTTKAYGRIEGGVVNAWDMRMMSAPNSEARSGRRVVVMASQGHLRLESIDVSGACAGEIYCMADNVIIQDALRAAGRMQLSGASGDGGRIYCEARNFYDPNIPGSISVSRPLEGAMVTVVPEDAVSLDCINAEAINEWWPDVAGIVEYEYQE